MEEEAPFKNKGEKIGISNMQNTKRKLYISSEEKAQNGEPYIPGQEHLNRVHASSF